MSKIIIMEGNSNDKDQVRTYYCKGEKGDKGDKGDKGQDGAYSKTSELTNDSGFTTLTEVENAGFIKTNTLFPIGALYFTATNTNPSSFLGGTWSRVAEGLFLVGVGKGTDENGVQLDFVAGANAGEYEHIQTIGELATHNHSFSANGTYAKPSGTSDVNADIGSPRADVYSSTTEDTISVSGTTDNKGTNQGMNIVNPSFGLYVWQRTA